MTYRVRLLSVAFVLPICLCAFGCSKRDTNKEGSSKASGTSGLPAPGASADASGAPSISDDVSATSADALEKSSESPSTDGKKSFSQACLNLPKQSPKPDSSKRLLYDVKATLFALADCAVPGDDYYKVSEDCKAPHVSARAAIRNVSHGIAFGWKAKRALWNKLVPIYRCGLMHPSQTVKYFSIYFGQGEFAEDRSTQNALRKLMFDSTALIASRAAAARFWRARLEDKETQALALKTLASHRLRLVREKACRYLSAPVFKGNRPIFDALFGFAGNTGEDRLIRRCAIVGMGMLGNDSDIPAILAFLSDLNLQKAAVNALKRGIRTSRAIEAYMTYFLTHSKKPSRITWYALDALLPYDDDLPKVPKQKTIQVLSNVLSAKDFHHFAREYAVRDLARLLAVDELQSAAQLYADAVDSDDILVKAAIGKALKKARQEQAQAPTSLPAAAAIP